MGFRYSARQGGTDCNAFSRTLLEELPEHPTASPARERYHADLNININRFLVTHARVSTLHHSLPKTPTRIYGKS